MLARVVLLQLASLTAVIALPAVDGLHEDVNSVVLVREKRDPSRSYTISGFMPGSGMSAFASSADYSPYHPRRPGHHPGGWSPQSEYPPEPASAEQPPERSEDKAWVPPAESEESERGEEAPATRPPKKNKKKYKHQQVEDEDEYEEPNRGGGGGNARASFNAWFPIIMGMYPYQGYPGQGQGQGVGEFRGAQGARDSPGHTTVIANSVSHGRSGVASSHAVVYSGGQGSPSNPHNR